MNSLLKITAFLCALLLTLSLLCACTGGTKTTDPEKQSDGSSPAASESTAVNDDPPSESAGPDDPAPVPPSKQGELSVGGQGSMPNFEW